jgi:hypothetical protein
MIDLLAMAIIGIGEKGCYIEVPQSLNPKVNLAKLVGRKVRIKRADYETYKVLKVEAPKAKDKGGKFAPICHKVFVKPKDRLNALVD